MLIGEAVVSKFTQRGRDFFGRHFSAQIRDEGDFVADANAVERTAAFAVALQTLATDRWEGLRASNQLEGELRTGNLKLAFVVDPRADQAPVSVNAPYPHRPVNAIEPRGRVIRKIGLQQAVQKTGQDLSLIIVPHARTSKMVMVWS